MDSFSYLNFYQIYRVPNTRGYTLNFVFSSIDAPPVEIANTPIVSPDPYHSPLFICFTIPCPITPQDTHTYSDYETMNHYLVCFNWQNTFSLYKVDDSAVIFNDALLSFINKFVPNKVWSPSKFPKWTSSTLENLITNKKKAHVIYKRTKSISGYLVFSEYKAKYKRQSKIDYSAHISRTEEALSSSPSNFWKFVNNFKQKPLVPLSAYL